MTVLASHVQMFLQNKPGHILQGHCQCILPAEMAAIDLKEYKQALAIYSP